MTITKEGALASFYTVNKAPIKHLRVYFSPKQAGTGDPSPENVREISGWNSINVSQTGRNLINWPIIDDYTSYNWIIPEALKNIPAYYSIYIDNTLGSKTARIQEKVYDNNGNLITNYTSGSKVSKGTQNRIYVIGNIPDAYSDEFTFLNLIGGTAKEPYLGIYKFDDNNEYEPYRGHIYSLDWANSLGTIYGGYVDLVTGELVKTHFRFRVPPNDVRGGTGDFVNNTLYQGVNHTHRYFYLGNYQIDTSEDPISNYLVKGNCSTTAWKYGFDGIQLLHYSLDNETIGVTSETSAADRNVAVANWITNNPIYICYKLKNPITYQLTPTQLQTLVGRNNIWSNADRVEVEYDLAESNDELYRRRNILLRSAPHIETVSGNIATFNTDMVAPIKSLKINFKPTQNLNGYNKAWPPGGWKNIFDSSQIGNSTSAAFLSLQLKPNTTYTFSSNKPSGNGGFSILTTNTNLESSETVYENHSITFTTLDNAEISIRYYNGTTAPLSDYWFQLEEGSIATSYAPYSNICPISGWTGLNIYKYGENLINLSTAEHNIIPIDWTSNGEIYGGYIDLISGKLIQTHYKIVADGINIKANSEYTGTNLFGAGIVYLSPQGNHTSDSLFVTTALCDTLPVFGQQESNTSGYKQILSCARNGRFFVIFYLFNKNDYNSSLTKAEKIAMTNNWLQEHPTTIVYKLATPIEHTLTPTQLKTLKGTNNIWSNANGPIELKYWTH